MSALEFEPQPHAREELWDIRELAAYLGVTTAGVHWLRTRYPESFPPPAIDRPGWYLWRRHDIQRWDSTTGYRNRNDGWNTHTVASHLGVSPQRVRAMYRDARLNFPAPTAQHPTRLTWEPDAIKRWAADHGYPKHHHDNRSRS